MLRKYPPNRRNGVMSRGPRVRAIVTEGEAAEMAYPVHITRKKIRNGFLRVCVLLRTAKYFISFPFLSINQFKRQKT